MKRASHIIATVALLLAACSHVEILHADPKSITDYSVKVRPGGIESNPVDGSNFAVEREIADDTTAIKSEKWYLVDADWDQDSDPWPGEDAVATKPPAVTTYTAWAFAKGLGELRLYVGTSKGLFYADFAVGKYKNPLLTQPKIKYNFGASRSDSLWFDVVEKHREIHTYEDWYANPDPDDQCIPIEHKGLAAEIHVGREQLYAATGYITKSIRVVKGYSKTESEQFSASASQDGFNAQFTWSTSETSSWAWSLEKDVVIADFLDTRISRPAIDDTVVDGYFAVKAIKDSPASPEDPTKHKCMPCPSPYCDIAVKHKYAHRIGTCPANADGDPMVPGCNQDIWSCDPHAHERHKVRTCILEKCAMGPLDNYDAVTCRKKFRHCKNEKQWHAKLIFLALYKLVKTIHSDGSVPPSSSSSDETSSSSDSDTLSPGETIEAHFADDMPYSQVYWYVRGPGETGYGTEVEIDTGDGVATVASLDYTFPSDADGEYTITAYVYRSDLSVYEESFTVTVEGDSSSTEPPASTVGLSSSDGSYTASAGGTHEANLVADGPYSQVYWYVKAPGEMDYGTQVEIDNGDGSTSEASLSYTFPAGVTGEYTITAYIYRWDLSVYEESYTVTVESVIGHTGH